MEGTKELCEAAYRAEQVPGTVNLVGDGEHDEDGYEVRFEESPVTIFPPEFSLFHRAPEIRLPKLTPFQARTSFPVQEWIEKVVVHDAKGRHEVPVEHAPDAIERSP